MSKVKDLLKSVFGYGNEWEDAFFFANRGWGEVKYIEDLEPMPKDVIDNISKELETLIKREVAKGKIDMLKKHVPYIMSNGEAKSKVEMIIELQKELK